MTAAEYVIDVLGGPKVFKGRTLPNATELRDRVRTGLPYQSLESDRLYRLARIAGQAVAVLGTEE